MQIIKPDRKTLFVLMAMGILLLVGWLAMRSPAQLASTATVARGPLEVVFQERQDADQGTLCGGSACSWYGQAHHAPAG